MKFKGIKNRNELLKPGIDWHFHGTAAHAHLGNKLEKGAWIFNERWCEVQAVIMATLGIASILT